MGCGSSKVDPPTAQDRVRLRPVDLHSQIPISPTQPIPNLRPPQREGSRPSMSSSGRRDVRRPSRTSYGDARRPSRTAYGDATRPYSSYSRRYPDPGFSSSRRPATSTSYSGPPIQSTRQFNPSPIPVVQYTEDKTIIDGASSLNNRIYQHAENYYHREMSADQSLTPELRDPRSRHAAIRQYVARTIIGSIILVDRDRSDEEISIISNMMSTYLARYSIPLTDGIRENHLLAVSRLGADLRRYMSSHPSNWGFGEWDQTEGHRSRFIMVFPPLLKDGQQVGSREIFRV